MHAAIETFKTYPPIVRLTILFTFFSFVWLYVILYFPLLKGDVGTRFLGLVLASFGLCYMNAKIINWARMLCVMVNVFALLQLAPPAIELMGAGRIVPGLLTVSIVVIFVISTGLLLHPSTAAFYKSRVKKTAPEAPEADIPEAAEPHEILGVEKDASRKQIHAAFDKLKKRYHPAGAAHRGEAYQKLATERYQRIKAAYETLAPSKKARKSGRK